MAEEKILNDEILEDAELEEVAGGTYREIRDDANRLRALGYLPRHGTVSKQDINDAFIQLGRDHGLKLGYNPSDTRANRYYVNHDGKNHEQIWNIIYDRIGGSY